MMVLGKLAFNPVASQASTPKAGIVVNKPIATKGKNNDGDENFIERLSRCTKLVMNIK